MDAFSRSIRDASMDEDAFQGHRSLKLSAHVRTA